MRPSTRRADQGLHGGGLARPGRPLDQGQPGRRAQPGQHGFHLAGRDEASSHADRTKMTAEPCSNGWKCTLNV